MGGFASCVGFNPGSGSKSNTNWSGRSAVVVQILDFEVKVENLNSKCEKRIGVRVRGIEWGDWSWNFAAKRLLPRTARES